MNTNEAKFIGHEQAKGDNEETNQKELSDQEAVELKQRFADALVRKVDERILSDPEYRSLSGAELHENEHD